MAQNLTDKWEMDKILTDNWHLQPPIQTLLKTYTRNRKNTFPLVILQRFSISGVISAEKM